MPFQAIGKPAGRILTELDRAVDPQDVRSEIHRRSEA